MQITNKFDNRCSKCGTPVKAGDGVAHKSDQGGRWLTYCKAHAPEQMVARAVVTERTLDVHGVVTMPYEARNVPLVKSMPGAKWDPSSKRWTVSLSEQDRLRVLEVADRLGLNVAPELRQLSTVTTGNLPDTLYPFQKLGVEWLARRERAILADEMGCGKTVEALIALPPGSHTIVVCPASLKYNWEKECKTWRKDLRPVVLSGNGSLDAVLVQISNRFFKTGRLDLQERSDCKEKKENIDLTGNHPPVLNLLGADLACGFSGLAAGSPNVAHSSQGVEPVHQVDVRVEDHDHPGHSTGSFSQGADRSFSVDDPCDVGQISGFGGKDEGARLSFPVRGDQTSTHHHTFQETSLGQTDRAGRSGVTHPLVNEVGSPENVVFGNAGASKTVGGVDDAAHKGLLLIVNYDVLPGWLSREKADHPVHAGVLCEFNLICDEAHFLTNPRTLRSKRINSISHNYAKRVLYLTGTPLTNDPSTLASILQSAGVFEEAFGHFGRFYKLFNARKKSKWGGIEWGTPDPIVPELLRRVMLRRTRAEVLPDLPVKTFTDMVVNGLSATLRSDLDAVWADQGELLEVTQGLPDFTEFSRTRAELAKAKIPAMLELIEQHEEAGIPLVVGSDHVAPLDACGARPGWAVIRGGVAHEERQRIQEAFQNGTLKGVAIQTIAGGVGLNLQRAWKLLQVDLNWTPANNSQLYDRLVRIGQKSKKVEIVRLVIDHPLEQHIHGIVAKKIAMIEATVEKTMVAEKNVPPVAPVNGQVGETDQEYAARMKAIADADQEAERVAAMTVAAQQQARAKSKVSGILDRERSRSPRVEKPLTPERIKSIQDGIRFLGSVCDGAVSRDNQGFNKPDAAIGRILSLAGLQDESELRAAEYILIRYPRQCTLTG